MKALKYRLTLTLLLSIVCLSCKKDWLNEKSDKKQFQPETITELQALLDNDAYMNTNAPWLGHLSADDYFVLNIDMNNKNNQVVNNLYTWKADALENNSLGKGNASFNDNWTIPYRMIFYANIASTQVEQIKVDFKNAADWSNVKGSALFFRAFALYELSQVFAPGYDKNTSSIDLGVPIKSDPGIDEPIFRSTVRKNYEQITGDLLAAYPLLPVNAKVKTRPCKAAAFALLARTYLQMFDYANAYKFADSALHYNSELLNYNQINGSATYPFPKFNAEVLFHCDRAGNAFSGPDRVDTLLYQSYQTDDLRKSLFFRVQADGYYIFRGPYHASRRLFAGLTIDEVYLIRAECAARLDNTAQALSDLNKLLITRWKTGTFVQLTASSATEALALILRERRKELLFRGLRWGDLRRLNKEPALATTLKRVIEGSIYQLPPNDLRYTLPIPADIIDFGHIPQNIRE